MTRSSARKAARWWRAARSAFITPLIPRVFIFIYAVGMFRSGMLQSFENPSDAYAWYCGKWVSKFMDISASS